jgi:hypothetical protein
MNGGLLAANLFISPQILFSLSDWLLIEEFICTGACLVF